MPLIGLKLKQTEFEIGHTVKDSRLFQIETLERAVKDAHEKAKIMANAAQCQLGDCIEIIHAEQEIYLYSERRTIHDAIEASCCNKESLDISPEKIQLTDDVTVSWALESKPCTSTD